MQLKVPYMYQNLYHKTEKSAQLPVNKSIGDAGSIPFETMLTVRLTTKPSALFNKT